MVLLLRDNETQVPLQNCAPFIDCITKFDGANIDDAQDLDLIM